MSTYCSFIDILTLVIAIFHFEKSRRDATDINYQRISSAIQWQTI